MLIFIKSRFDIALNSIISNYSRAKELLISLYQGSILNSYYFVLIIKMLAKDIQSKLTGWILFGKWCNSNWWDFH